MSMILRRLVAVVPLLLAVSFAVYSLEVFLPGDPALTIAGADASDARVDEVRTALGLDRPLPVRYVEWLGDAVQGDLGNSLFTRRSVTQEITSRWLVTATLVVGAMGVALLVGVPAGILAGRHKGGWIDRIATLGASLGVAIPHFLPGILLMVVLASNLRWLPVAGYRPFGNGLWAWGKHFVLPILALSGVMTAELTRQVRSALAETLESDYIRTARSKGLSERTVLVKHGLRVAASPAISVISVQAARLFGGAVIIELVFGLPGLGRLTVDAILNRDLPVLQGVVPLAVIIAIVMTLLADVLQLVLHPRLRTASR